MAEKIRYNDTEEKLQEKYYLVRFKMLQKEYYKPKWSKKERRWIAIVMKNGFEVLPKGLNIN